MKVVFFTVESVYIRENFFIIRSKAYLFDIILFSINVEKT